MKGSATATKPQLEMDVDDPAQVRRAKEREGDAQALLFEQLLAACRAIARELTYDYCANEIDFIWGDRGRPVSSAVLRAALNDSRGNYFRLEMAIWFARQDGAEKVQDLLLEAMKRGLPEKEPKDELADLKQAIRDEYPKQAEKLIRRGKAPR